MKRGRSTEEQIIAVRASRRLGQRRRPGAQARHLEATQYNWKAKYGGMEVSEAKRLRMLEDENRKRRSRWRNRCSNVALKELLERNGSADVKRDAVAHSRGVLEMSERRACSLVAAERKDRHWSRPARQGAYPSARACQSTAPFRLSPPINSVAGRR